MLKNFISVTKPGIILGNMISVAGGFLLAAKGNVPWLLFIATLLGVALVIASACVFNNYIDRDIDSLMQRTRNRVLVRGLISPSITLCYATLLGLSGFLLLLITVNLLVAVIAVLGFIVYVGFYTLYMKRRSVYGTLIGSLSGAVPPIIGYCAVSGQFDTAALILLLIFSIWQMPHSYAIAIYRYNDYVAASIPVLPIVKGVATTKHHITFYIIAFIIAIVMLALVGYVNYRYLAVVVAVSLWWLGMAIGGYRTANDHLWAKNIFIFSIVAIVTLNIMISIDFHHSGVTEGIALLNHGE